MGLNANLNQIHSTKKAIHCDEGGLWIGTKMHQLKDPAVAKRSVPQTHW